MKKFLKILNFIFNTILTIIIVIGIVFITLYIIGIEPFVVQSGSMEPKIETGSLCFINKLTKFEDINQYDIIAFKLPTGVGVTHRVVEISNEGLITKGDNNDTNDLIITTKENYIGKNVFSIPKIGYVIKLIQTTRGKIIFGTVIIVLFLAGILIGEPSKKKKQKISEKAEQKQDSSENNNLNKENSDNLVNTENNSKNEENVNETNSNEEK